MAAPCRPFGAAFLHGINGVLGLTGVQISPTMSICLNIMCFAGEGMPLIHIDFDTGALSGGAGEMIESVKTIGALAGVFEDEAARAAMEQDMPAYRVQMCNQEKDGTPGGLFFGTSFVYPGKVGKEYFMTRGHFHQKKGHAEYYWCIQGEGLLLLMDEAGVCRAEKLSRGSLHYIPGYVAHRLINTGDKILAVGACWPSDAGHDYGTIERDGFSVSVIQGDDGKPVMMKKEKQA